MEQIAKYSMITSLLSGTRRLPSVPATDLPYDHWSLKHAMNRSFAMVLCEKGFGVRSRADEVKGTR